ncbi:MAG TPA: 3-phosphoshikimate 1-carboxyvinyltransferase, partial [Burkholderiales bacterium]|nr:3-phosphoshikimate 1-carboxyvinyltransferase [Burkholderiales bacterium]
MDSLELKPARRASGTVRLPGSKSISNRVLLLAALARGTTEVRGLLDADDTRVMIDALRLLGVQVTEKADAVDVGGVGGPFPEKKADLFLGNAGTALRPLAAVLALSEGEYHVRGVARMHERPIGDLVDALRGIGAHVEYAGREGYPPLTIHPARIAPRTVKVKGDVSSQFLTGLLMALPVLRRASRIEVEGELISRPYVELTLNTMRRFGVDVERGAWTSFGIPASSYVSPGEIRVEGDASSASYFLAAGALGGGPVRVEGVGRESVQGDVRFVEVLERMGAQVLLGEEFVQVRNDGRKLRAID